MIYDDFLSQLGKRICICMYMLFFNPKIPGLGGCSIPGFRN